ncbi:MAG: hypothetical protein Q8M31_08795 [Beijerinckiaceae bacterium]|nr:hypothetical protein [Beijerinckiaceae bacterium]
MSVDNQFEQTIRAEERMRIRKIIASASAHLVPLEAMTLALRTNLRADQAEKILAQTAKAVSTIIRGPRL